MATNLGTQVNWATPRAGKTTDEDPQTWQKRKDKGEVATMPLGTQVKNWTTPKASHSKFPGKNRDEHLTHQAEQWATPRNMTGGTCKNGAKHCDLNSQAGGKLNPKWVCQLMGIPTDWVYPSEDERNRTDELRMLGNGVVPWTAAKAFVTLTP